MGVDPLLLQGPSSELSLAAPAPKTEAEVVLLPNGCLCCKVRSNGCWVGGWVAAWVGRLIDGSMANG